MMSIKFYKFFIDMNNKITEQTMYFMKRQAKETYNGLAKDWKVMSQKKQVCLHFNYPT